MMLSNISDYVCFTIPFGWQELGIVATVVAVFIALFANHQSKKQLLSAFKIQEQNKNIGLFEKRISVLDEIENNLDVSQFAVRVLFNEEIANCYEELTKRKSSLEGIQHDLSHYQYLCEVEAETKVTDVDVWETIQRYEQSSIQGFTEEMKSDFQQFCNKHCYTSTETGNPEDTKVYNYFDLRQKSAELKNEIKVNKQNVLIKMEDYISKGILDLSEKPKGKSGRT